MRRIVGVVVLAVALSHGAICTQQSLRGWFGIRVKRHPDPEARTRDSKIRPLQPERAFLPLIDIRHVTPR